MTLSNYILIRVDDVGQYLPQKDIIISRLCQLGMKVTCAVVPEWIELGCINYLMNIASEFPEQLEIHQHGYRHQNYGVKYKFEFGYKRRRAEQHADILIGKKILQSHFENLFFPVFTPPYGSCNKDTLSCLVEENFQFISTLPNVPQNGLILDIKPSIDLFQWNPIIERKWEDIELEWLSENGSDLRDLRGFIIHPRLMSDESIINITNRLAKIIDPFKTVTFSNVQKILNSDNSSTSISPHV